MEQLGFDLNSPEEPEVQELALEDLLSLVKEPSLPNPQLPELAASARLLYSDEAAVALEAILMQAHIRGLPLDFLSEFRTEVINQVLYYQPSPDYPYYGKGERPEPEPEPEPEPVEYDNEQPVE